MLTPRSADVLRSSFRALNKQIAGDLGISEKTVKFHRGRVMEKRKPIGRRAGPSGRPLGLRPATDRRTRQARDAVS
jgi:hypothetical protein